ncbi:g6148 [Coccomyxa elongata]
MDFISTCFAAMLLLFISTSAARELQQYGSSSASASAMATASTTPVTQTGPVVIAEINPWSLGRTYPPVNVAAGSSVRFIWPSTTRHGLYQIPSGQCPQSFTPTPSNGIVALVKAANGGSFTTPALVPGAYWFACPVPTHCPSGMIVKVTVT